MDIFVIFVTVKKAFISFALSLLSICATALEERYISFSHLSVGEGLSQITINDLYVDEMGQIWIATANGLNRYDGSNVQTFLVGDDGNDLRFNEIWHLSGDGVGKMYILCPREVYEMDLRTQKMTLIYSGVVNSLCWNGGLYLGVGDKVLKREAGTGEFGLFYTLDNCRSYISSLFFSSDGAMWLGTNAGGAFRIADGDKRELASSAWVGGFYETSDGCVWVATRGDGAYCIDRDWNITHFLHEDSPRSLISDQVRTFCEDNLGQLWVGTFNGLDRLDRNTGAFYHYVPDVNRSDAISHASVWAIRKDAQGTLWVGTFFGGVSYFNPEYEIYSKYKASDKERDGLSSPIIGDIIEDRDGNLWIGTEGGGLDFYDRKSGEFRWFNKGAGNGRDLPETNVKALYYDREASRLWVGLHLFGASRMDLGTGRITNFRFAGTSGGRGTFPTVRALLPYNDSLLVGTGEVNVFDPASGRMHPLFDSEKYKELPKSITSLMGDTSGSIWIGTSNDGVYRYRPGTGRLRHYAAGSESLSYRGIHNIFQDSRGNIWICTGGGGLDLYIPKSDSFDNFNSRSSGLLSDCVYKVTESPVTGNLIILTNRGLSIYSQETGEFRSLSAENGFPFSNTNELALLCTRDGTIFCGSPNGMISFPESSLDIGRKPYSILLSKLSVDGREVNPGDPDGILPESMAYTNSLTLGPRCSMFTFHITTNNYIAANSDELEYRLEGFSDKWNQLSHGQKDITYCNLSAGRYRLIVRPVRENSLCTPLEVDIHLLHPWYFTPLAWCLYAILILLGIISLVRFYNSRVKLSESLKYEQQRAADIEDLNQSKLRFFTNISHEIRTPLTIIIAEVESLMHKQNFTPALYNKILSIYKNSISLRELVNELLEFRKQEQGEMKIRVSAHNIISFINEFFLLFEDYASSKGIHLAFEKETESLEVWYDRNQLQKVFNNLLSNALKHTPDAGKVTIRAYAEKGSAVVEIADTGCGIPSDELENIFKRFYQVSDAEESTGTGIGLSLAKGIVELHGGTLSVSSEVGVGTTFKVSLPLGYSHFTKEQIEIESAEVLDGQAPLQLMPEDSENSPEGIHGKGHKIVLAEDNDGVRKVLTEIFSPLYEVFTAENGAEALELIQKLLPSIVVSDVLMPKMSGIELCRRVKENIDTCHIPVVLLTARVAVEQNLEGLLTGADDYIAKPFNTALLLSRCNNLVNSRILLQEKFSNQPASETRILATNKLDREFIDKAVGIIGENMSNPDFSVVTFAKEMTISRTGLFAKIKAITGQTPNDFIMTIRLKKGASMLKSCPGMNVTEISEKIGFGSSRYFTKCFKEAYGITPLAYRKQK